MRSPRSHGAGEAADVLKPARRRSLRPRRCRRRPPTPGGPKTPSNTLNDLGLFLTLMPPRRSEAHHLAGLRVPGPAGYGDTFAGDVPALAPRRHLRAARRPAPGRRRRAVFPSARTASAVTDSGSGSRRQPVLLRAPLGVHPAGAKRDARHAGDVLGRRQHWRRCRRAVPPALGPPGLAPSSATTAPSTRPRTWDAWRHLQDVRFRPASRGRRSVAVCRSPQERCCPGTDISTATARPAAARALCRVEGPRCHGRQRPRAQGPSAQLSSRAQQVGLSK
jgi:hypothetical protein